MIKSMVRIKNLKIQNKNIKILNGEEKMMRIES